MKIAIECCDKREEINFLYNGVSEIVDMDLDNFEFNLEPTFDGCCGQYTAKGAKLEIRCKSCGRKHIIEQ